MPDIFFPTLQASSWKLTRTPQWKTLTQTSATGKRVRAALRSKPLWSWTLKNGILQSAPLIGDLQAIQDLFNTCQGSAGSFLWRDPEDTTIQDSAVQELISGVLYWRVAFMDDSLDFERFAHSLWELSEVSFGQVKS